MKKKIVSLLDERKVDVVQDSKTVGTETCS